MGRELRVHERLRYLQMFRLLVTMMLRELAATQLGGAWAFVLRCVVATLLQALKPQERWGFKDMFSFFLSVLVFVCLRSSSHRPVCVALCKAPKCAL